MIDKLNSTSGGVTVSAGLLLSPWWSRLLSDMSVILTVASLTIGLLVGLLTLWLRIRKLMQ
jgi:hypothetical protein